ncbi:MAG TPA: membrane protein insertase YidC [Rhabdochlamydiaceae bacterium]|nr:membrane protein insertase YidC [Rhabdochlamydiaceae bacterium]
MDKRAIVFVIVLTACLFFVNQWFGSKDKERRMQHVQKEQVQRQELQEKIAKDAAARTAPLSQIPVVEVFIDPQGKDCVAEAVKIDGQYLLLAWTTPLPEHLYTSIGDGKFERIFLRIDTKSKMAPSLYSSDPQAALPVAYLPEIGSSDLQIVYFTENVNPHVALAVYEEGTLYFPLGKIQYPGIALYKGKTGYLPYGVYDPSKSRVKQLEEYAYFGGNLSPQFFGVTEETASREQQFYVLENAFQQLVFSNIGGALSEINLPFRTDENKESVVREIGFDRTFAKDYVNNDFFPSFPYQIVKTEGAAPTVVKVGKGKLGGYYPLVRRSVLGSGGHITHGVPPHYYACNIVSDDPTTAAIPYKVRRFEKNLIEFEGVEGTRRIIKTFSFPKNPHDSPYCFDVSVKIEGDARGLYITSGIPEVELISGNFSPALKYRITRNGKSVVEKLDLPKTTTTLNSVQPDWVCNSNGFMGIIVDPLTEIGSGLTTFNIPGNLDPTRLSLIDSQYHIYPTDKYPGYEMHLPLPVSAQTTKFRVFAGPFDTTTLKRVDASYSNPATGYNPDYVSCQSFHGWFSFISEPFAQFLFILMKFFHKITFSWGVSIILLTIVLRIMLYPLNAWSIRSTTRMQEISPQVTAIQEKHKKDPKRAQMEVMNLYREKGVNPLTGCLPLLIQMPFLIGMFDLLKSSFELRGVSFIPGWIDNLTAPDVLFTWSYPIFFIGTQFHLLPILLGLVMYVQQKFTSAISKNQRVLTDQQKQQKFMGNIMVIVFAVMFYHFPSGLNIYWLSSMLLGILQQWYMTKKKANKPVVLSNKS